MNEQGILSIVILLGVLLVSATLHEAMHGFIAYWLGDDTAKRQGRLTLNPIKHIDPLLSIVLPLVTFIATGIPFGGAKPVPFNPDRLRHDEWGAALVALAGPLTNFFIAFVLYGIAVLSGFDIAHLSYSTPFEMVLTIGVVANLALFIFNLIPIPPLDGSRVLYALAPEFVRRGMEYVEQYGLMLVLVIVLLATTTGILGAFMQTAIVFFLTIFAKLFMLG